MLEIYISVKNTYSSILFALKIAADNANNFNTPGFKSSEVRFTTSFAQTLRKSLHNVNPISVTSGVDIGSTMTDWSQGALNIGTENDVAIVGRGLFVLSPSSQEFDPEGEKLYTRAGQFLPDADNKYLVDSHGRKVFGFKVNQNGDPISNTMVPIETDGETDIGFIDGGILVNNFEAHQASVDTDTPPHPERKNLYRLALTSFSNLQGLVPHVGSAWKASLSTFQLEVGVSEQNGYGSIFAQRQEGSSVDVAKVALDMNRLNRAISAVNGIIDDLNKIYSNIMSKIAG